MKSPFKPTSMTLNMRINEKTEQQIFLLNATSVGRKEAVGLKHKTAKLKNKFDNYKMM